MLRSSKMNLAFVVSKGLVSVKLELVMGMDAVPCPSNEPELTVL
jgi:hypothetical protein